MSHPLEQRIDAVRTRVQRLLAAYALGWVVATVLSAAIILVALDYVLRFRDPGLRVLSTLALAAVAAYVLYRYVYLGLARRLRDVELARRIERRFPVLRDRLASAVEFLQQSEDDPTAGSVALRRAVIAETTARTEHLDFGDVICYRAVVRALLLAAAIVLVALILAALNPTAFCIGVARLANPLGNTVWPRTTHLVLGTPVVNRLARGKDFEVTVTDRDGSLPPRVRIHYRFEDSPGSVTEEAETMRQVGTAAVARRENVTRPFSYWVEGGDDQSLPWIAVEVVEPAGLESVAITLRPPLYTGWPTSKASQHIRALVGTELSVTGRATRPLRAAAFCLEGGRRFPGRLASDGRTFAIPARPGEKLVIDRSGSYWFELADAEGLVAGSEVRWEIRAVPDAPPTPVIEQPTATVYVTPQAVLPVRVAVKDDLAIREVDLAFSRSDQTGRPETVYCLYRGPDRVPPRAAGLEGDEDSGESRVVNYDWQLGLLGVAPGTEITFYALAADYRPQTGKSEPRRLTVITPQELAERIAARQAFVLSELGRVLQMQEQSRGQVAGLEIRLQTVGSLSQLDLDQLRGAELNQRQVDRTLTSRSDGVAMHVAGLLDELRNNKVDSSDVQRQLEQLLAEIERLQRGPLPVIGRQLTAAVKSAQVRLENAAPKPPADREKDVAAALSEAGKNQDQVIASLENMLAQLARWDKFRRFHREIAQLLHDQEDLARHTMDLGRRTLTKDLRDLLPQDVADLKIAGRSQAELARRLDTILQAMDQAGGQLQESDPLAAQTVADALARARELAISSTMRAAGDAIPSNQMGQAMASQKRAIDDLQEILDILANRRESELARLVRKLREAETALADMVRREDALAKQAGQADRQAALDEFRRQQQQLREEAERLARRLERLMAEQAGKSIDQATQKMSQAEQSAGQKSGAQAADQAQRAAKDLQDALDRLVQQRRQAEVELATEQLARLEDSVKSLQRRQQKALEETQRLDRLAHPQGAGAQPPARLTDAQAADLRNLAGEQKLLSTETAALSEDLAGAEVFHLVLGAAADQMAAAADLLRSDRADAPVQQAQQSALASLAQLLEALRPEEPAGQEGNPAGGQGPQGPQATPSAAAVQAFAQLKLLKLMQLDINRRTQELDAAVRAAGGPTQESRAQYAELSRQQGRLADLMMGLIPPAEDPENVPGGPPQENPSGPPDPLDQEPTP